MPRVLVFTTSDGINSEGLTVARQLWDWVEADDHSRLGLGWVLSLPPFLPRRNVGRRSGGKCAVAASAWLYHLRYLRGDERAQFGVCIDARRRSHVMFGAMPRAV